jgi:hypothetical protein
MRGAESVEQQHALSRLAQVPGGPGAEHAGTDDDGIPGGFAGGLAHVRTCEAGGERRSNRRSPRDALAHASMVPRSGTFC